MRRSEIVVSITCEEAREEIEHWIRVLREEVDGYLGKPDECFLSHRLSLRLSGEASMHLQGCADCADYLRQMTEQTKAA